MAKKFNVDSNVYIILYSVVMVVVVAALLAVVSLSLQGRQNDNALNEKKQQIVMALGEDPAAADYDSIIAEAVMLDASGKQTDGDVFEALQDLKGSIAAGRFPLFKAKNGCVVIPVYGAGLWDAIWGYIALEPDMNTVKGIVLDHKGETPGLGAEIATPAHQAKYAGKTVFEGDDFVSITLKKGGASPADANYAHEVDAITGGTKTSDGVTEMIRSGLGNYLPYLKANKSNN